ncbi:hypothetical protein E8E95_02100 [Pseudomonas sp. BN414]|uniref:TniQ family protein n=1 Tax=unclassified Pseudomonas TaxID=196821 RepID=UPI002454162A|nr:MULTISPECIES: hypothetical protein [unclassified Pseudomonas]MDH4565470.1 hypothetical protein [Pseudomonas sp. BN414]MDH4580795.1 hypothetical protein [Pseudomonas sp. BN415]
MKDFAFIPLPLPEESPTSLLKRAAIRNGYRSIDEFLSFYFQDLPVRGNLLRQDTIVTERLTYQAGEYGELLKTGFYRATHKVLTNSNLLINNIEVKKRLIRFKGAAICSECCEEGWEKNTKDFSLAENCPYHSRKYLFSCSKCQRNFTWRNQITTECKCGEQIKSPQCSEAEVRPEKQLLRLLRSNSQHAFDLFSSTLQSLGLGSKNSNPFINRSIFSTALAIALEDMDMIIPGLQRLFSNESIIDERFLSTKLSHLTPPHIKSFILNKPPSARPANQHASDLTFSLTTQQLLAYLGINNKQWNTIRTHKLFPKKEKRCCTYSQQEAAAINQIIELIAKQRESDRLKKETSIINLSTAAQHLKVDRHVFRELVKSGLLGKKIRQIDGFYAVSATAIESFSCKYVCIQTIAKEACCSLNTVRKAIKQLATPTIPLAPNSKFTTVIPKESAQQVITAIQALLPSYKRGVRHKLSAKLQVIESDKTTNHYSTTEASKLLDIDRTIIRQLVRNGILNATYRTKFSEYLIPKDEIENFNKKYMNASEVSETLLLPRKKTTDILAAHGITPVIARSAGSCDITLFHRSDIPIELIKKTETNTQILYKEHSSNRLIKLSEASSLTGITIKSLSMITKAIVLPFRPLHYQSIKKLSSIEFKMVLDYYKSTTPVSEILDKYGIPPQSFTQLFILSKYVKPIRINGNWYLDAKDKENVIKVLEEFCTCTQADFMLGAPPRYTRNLIIGGRIQPATPPRGIPIHPTLIERNLVTHFKDNIINE